MDSSGLCRVPAISAFVTFEFGGRFGRQTRCRFCLWSNQRNSSTDSLTNLLNFILPQRSTSGLPPKPSAEFKYDENGYGSDFTKAATIDSPIGSIKLQTSNASEDSGMDSKTTTLKSDSYNKDTDTAETYKPDRTFVDISRKSSKKRSRSKRDNFGSFSRRKSLRMKKSPSNTSSHTRNTEEDANQNYCDRLRKPQY